MFDKFYRAEANNRMAKGTGLGLSLVKHIVETVHHGTDVRREPGGQGQLLWVRVGSCASESTVASEPGSAQDPERK